jgi:hypothetical protein
MKPKKKYSPHLSIKRLTALSKSFLKENWKQVARDMDISDRYDQQHFLDMYIEHVEQSRPSLGGRPKSLPVREKKKI